MDNRKPDTRKLGLPFGASVKKKLVPISKAFIRPDQPLLFPLYREDGALLAEKGIILSENQVKAIVAEETFTVDYELVSAVYGQKDRGESVPDYRMPSTFERLRQIEQIVQSVYEDPLQNTNLSRLLTAVGRITNVCQQSPDACLAKIILDDKKRYTVQHTVHTAILTVLVAQFLGWRMETIRALAGASLTMNVAMGFLQDDLQKHSGELPSDQKDIIRFHPTKSVQLLTQIGVRDKTWLEIVEKHHENVDGSGYPNKLKAEDIPLEASLLHLADIYCAKITGRTYREPMIPNVAARDIFLNKDNHPKGTLIEIFVKVIGLYPPGCLIKLNNGEVGVVVKRGGRVDTPIVKALFNPQGGALSKPITRNTDQKPTAIKEILAHDPTRKDIDFEKLWN